MVDKASGKRLGRGLASLIGELDHPVPIKAEANEGELSGDTKRPERRLPIEAIRANPDNPRRHFSDQNLDDLSASIGKHGLIQPILVRPASGSDETFEIVAGERRWRAAQRAGLHEIPVIVREVDNLEALELAIIENVQRDDLNPIEEARGYRQLMDQYEYKQDDLAQAIGKSRSHVANILRLLKLPAGVQSLRLQFNPLANDGRYLIMRILYSGDGKMIDLSDLGYSDEQVRQIAIMSARPVGINIVSGPTGSGKSTTLKAVLEQVIRKRNGEVNTITIEDPPEYVIADAQQMPVTNAKTQDQRSEAFTQAISAGLRSDPDIMMIGEIRDLASAALAVEGALSGHPIYASLHANTAMDILTRLRDMGIEDFKVFDPTVFSGLVGQRLVRQLCPCCKVPLETAVELGDIDPLVQERIQAMVGITPDHAMEDRTIYTAGLGCEECTGGYNGRPLAILRLSLEY